MADENLAIAFTSYKVSLTNPPGKRITMTPPKAITDFSAQLYLSMDENKEEPMCGRVLHRDYVF